RDRVSGLEDELVEADDDAQGAAEHEAELVAAVAHERVVRARRAAGLVGGLDELDVLVRPEPEPLPGHARLEVDGRALVCALDGETWLRGRRRPRSGGGVAGRGRLLEEQLVGGDAEL